MLTAMTARLLVIASLLAVAAPPTASAQDMGDPCTSAEVTIVLAFDLYGGRVEDRERGTIDRLAALLRACPDRSFELQLHTDTVRTSAFNRRASQSVAEHVRAMLVERGIPADRLAPCGYGESRPLSIDPSWDQRTPNQRLVLRALPGPAAAHRCPAP